MDSKKIWKHSKKAIGVIGSIGFIVVLIVFFTVFEKKTTFTPLKTVNTTAAVDNDHQAKALDAIAAREKKIDELLSIDIKSLIHADTFKTTSTEKPTRLCNIFNPC
jgi:hypothetical protein